MKFGGLKFLDAAHVKDMLALLRFVENPRDRIAGFRVLHLLPGMGPLPPSAFSIIWRKRAIRWARCAPFPVHRAPATIGPFSSKPSATSAIRNGHGIWNAPGFGMSLISTASMRTPKHGARSEQNAGRRDSCRWRNCNAGDERKTARDPIVAGLGISVLHEAGAIRECETHGWMQDRADPHARERAFEIARQILRLGLRQRQP